MDLSARIRTARKKKRLTQPDLADEIGVSYMTVRRWETGKASPRIKEIEELSKVLSVPVEYFMGGDDAPPETPLISLPISNMEKENKTPEYLDLGYWGNIVENAKRAAKLGTEQEKAAALMMLRMAVDAITGTERKPTEKHGANIFQTADGVHGNVKQTISTVT